MSTNYKADFPLLAQRDVAYLDSAATAQRPQCVLDAEREFYTRHNANPLRGLYPLSTEATEALESARAGRRPLSRRGAERGDRLHPQHDRGAEPCGLQLRAQPCQGGR